MLLKHNSHRSDSINVRCGNPQYGTQYTSLKNTAVYELPWCTLIISLPLCQCGSRGHPTWAKLLKRAKLNVNYSRLPPGGDYLDLGLSVKTIARIPDASLCLPDCFLVSRKLQLSLDCGSLVQRSASDPFLDFKWTGAEAFRSKDDEIWSSSEI